MIYSICSLFDEKTRLFGNPMMFINLEEAKRYFSFVVLEDKNRLISKDLVLYEICSFDSSNGLVIPLSIPCKVMTAYEVLGGE